MGPSQRPHRPFLRASHRAVRTHSLLTQPTGHPLAAAPFLTLPLSPALLGCNEVYAAVLTWRGALCACVCLDDHWAIQSD
jgi:hypothetical protein